MKIGDALRVKRDKDAGKSRGRVNPARKTKPGREIRDGHLCYDGSGPSGYTGRCHTSGYRFNSSRGGRQMMLVPRDSLSAKQLKGLRAGGGRRSKRPRKNVWVPVS